MILRKETSHQISVSKNKNIRSVPISRLPHFTITDLHKRSLASQKKPSIPSYVPPILPGPFLHKNRGNDRYLEKDGGRTKPALSPFTPRVYTPGLQLRGYIHCILIILHKDIVQIGLRILSSPGFQGYLYEYELRIMLMDWVPFRIALFGIWSGDIHNRLLESSSSIYRHGNL